MSETPDQRVQRLAAELAAAQADQRVAHLQAELSGARSTGGDEPVPSSAAGGGSPADLATLAVLREFDDPGSDAGDGHVYNPGAGARLAGPPRRVPPAFLMAALRWRWWEAWAFLMVAVAPIALWMSLPWSATMAGIIVLLVAILLRLRAARVGFVLLRNGQVAGGIRIVADQTGTYFSGVTYQNVRMAVAHGWQVTRQWYSGPGTRSILHYTVGGQPGTMTLHGLPYAGGVVLADPRKPDRARCVSEFPYDLNRDADGNWIGTVPTRVWVGSLFTLAMWAGWVVLILAWQFNVVR